jgi:hypothetical protein
VVDRVVEDVFEGGVVLLLRLDHLRPEALAEDVVLALVALVEGASVLAVQVAHPVREVREGRLDDQVVVVAEQAAGVETPVVAALDAPQDLEEDGPVPVVLEDRRVVVPLRSEVVVGPGGEVAVRSPHPATVAPPSRFHRPFSGFGAPSLRTRHVPGKVLGTSGQVRVLSGHGSMEGVFEGGGGARSG